MSELEEIRTRAAERRIYWPEHFDPTVIGNKHAVVRQAEADLDRAIAGWEQSYAERDAFAIEVREGLRALEKERDRARAEVERLTTLRSTQASERREADVKMWAEECKQARADVLALRERMMDYTGSQPQVIRVFERFLADTESYEEWRTAQEPVDGSDGVGVSEQG